MSGTELPTQNVCHQNNSSKFCCDLRISLKKFVGSMPPDPLASTHIIYVQSSIRLTVIVTWSTVVHITMLFEYSYLTLVLGSHV